MEHRQQQQKIERSKTKKMHLTKSMKGQKHLKTSIKGKKYRNPIAIYVASFILNSTPFRIGPVWFEYMQSDSYLKFSEFQYPFYVQSGFYSIFVQFVYQTRGCFSPLSSHCLYI